MKGKRYSEEQIIYALKAVDSGQKAAHLCRELGVTEVTFYRWKKQYAGMGVSELRRLKLLEEENRRLKSLGGRSDARQAHLAGGDLKKSLKPAARRTLAYRIIESYELSAPRACRLMKLHRTTLVYKSQAQQYPELKLRLRDLALTRIRFGYRRLTVMLQREGWAVGKKRVYRFYRELGLVMRTKRYRKRAGQARGIQPQAQRANERWSMDFVTDRLQDGRYFRTLTIVDQYTRECPLLYAAQSLSGKAVAICLSQLARERGQPKTITVDNGTEFYSKAMDAWRMKIRSSSTSSGPAGRWRTGSSRVLMGG